METEMLHQIPFTQLTEFFEAGSEHMSMLVPYKGKGFVQIFALEQGLQAKLWDCTFREGIEVFCDPSVVKNMHFNLGFFPNTKGLHFSDKSQPFRKQEIWDTIFISAFSSYRMYIPPNVRYRCLSISFSQRWLNENILACNKEFINLKKKIFSTNLFSLLELMNPAEKKFVEELFDTSWERSLGTFYIKSAVLKVVIDFFYKIKDRKIENDNEVTNAITEIEKYLSSNLNALPNLEYFATKYSISQSTLKRHFKKNYNSNISAYFMRKKMDYAHNMINQEQMSIPEVAKLLGYSNFNHFVSMLKKYKIDQLGESIE